MPTRIFGGPGFMVSTLEMATGGVVTPDVLWNYGLPAQRGQFDVDTHLARLYGVDLAYPGDYVLKANGDLQLTRGIGAFKAMFARSLVMPPGSLFWRPEWGVGLNEFLNLPASAANLHEMKNRIQRSAASDPAIEEVTRNDVLVDRSTIGLIEVFTDFVVSGQPISNALEIRSTV